MELTDKMSSPSMAVTGDLNLFFVASIIFAIEKKCCTVLHNKTTDSDKLLP